MTLGELKIQATKLVEEYEPNDKEFTDDEDVAIKMSAGINYALSFAYAKDSSIRLIEITDTTPNELELGSVSNDETALGIPIHLLSALPYGVASKILVGDGYWNMSQHYNDTFLEMISIGKPKITIVEGNPKWQGLR